MKYQHDNPHKRKLLESEPRRLVVLSGPNPHYVGDWDFGSLHVAEAHLTLCGVDLSRDRYDNRRWRVVDPKDTALLSSCGNCIRVKNRMEASR